MTEQPPSAEAVRIADALHLLSGNRDDGVRMIDALCEQRVAAETERWQNRDRQRCEQIDRLQEAVQSLQNASAERPAPERDATAIRDALARLREKDVREAVAKAIYDIDPIGVRDWSNAPVSTREDCFACADAAITKITEMLK